MNVNSTPSAKGRKGCNFLKLATTKHSLKVMLQSEEQTLAYYNTVRIN